jgi:DNA-binding MarR family transcriptional regulator
VPRSNSANLPRLGQTVMLGDVPIRLRPSPLALRFQQICSAMMAEALAGEDLTPLQYSAFPYLREEPGLDQVGLAARLGIDRTNAGLLVDKLQEIGLVERRIDSSDRRVRRLHLTQRGIELQDRIRPITRRTQAKILDCLSSSEQATLIALLVRVIQANEKFARPGLGRRKRRTAGRRAGQVKQSSGADK